MAQQINLCTAAFRPPKQRFTAKTLVQLFGIFLLIGALVSGALLQGLQRSGATYQSSVASRGKEIEALQAAIAQSRANAAPVDSALAQQLQEKQAATARTEKILAAVQQGVFTPGQGNSDRLQMVARSIPQPVWLVDIRLDAGKFEVNGFTLEPAALNEWVGTLRNQPLMQSFELNTVSVDAVSGAQRPTWAFSLVSAAPIQAPPSAPPAAANGATP